MNQNQMIRITSVQGGRDRNRRLLMNCFFVPTGQAGFYNLFDPSGRNLLGEGVTSGQSFEFGLDRLTWTMTLEQIDARFAHGSWSNNDVDPESEDLHSHLNTVESPLNTLEADALCPGSSVLEKINASLR